MLLTKLANQEVVNFLRTATIKNSFFADQLLKALVNPRYRDAIPERLNPYYLHLTGQYILKKDVHAWITDPSTGVKVSQVYTAESTFLDDKGHSVTVENARLYDAGFDEMMYVTSLDTHDEIPFTRRNLHGCEGNTSVHKKTLEAYKVGGRYFNLLCEKYPKQVDLIKSIVYLVPEKELSEADKAFYGASIPSSDDLRMMNAIGAKHLELISGDETLFEGRERHSIMSAIHSLLDIFRTRWSVREYTYEDNYASVMWAALWSLLPMAIIAQRYANIKGPNVHSSHIWDYLTSHGLDSYRGYLNSEQEAFLYKNINYLRLHGNEHRILNILVDNLLSAYNLHIESKSVVVDTADSLKVDTVDGKFDTQCARCARNEICFKRINTYKCKEFLGTKNTCKPTSVILSEELPGARKDRIIKLLKQRYGYTDAEAESKYDRSFMWKDDVIETIREELDRDQVTTRDQITDSLGNTINREHESGLEPVYTQAVVDAQHAELRHAHSAVIPTKLLEIVEDPTEPKYEEMFTRFVTDTLFHLAPKIVGIEHKEMVDESFKVLIGQEALQLTLTYGEMLAAMYLGFLKEFKPDLVVDDGTSQKIITDFKNYSTFDIKVPTEAVLSTTFKLGKPVKQDDLCSAMIKPDPSYREKGSYVLTKDTVMIQGKTYYVRTIEGYEVYEGEFFESDTEYFEFITLPDMVTNLPEGAKASDVTIAAIDGELYGVITRPVEITDVDWLDYDTVFEIIGRFDNRAGSYIYHENNDEIPVIPEYVRWHSRHMSIPSARYLSELEALNLKEGCCYSWNNETVYEVVDGKLVPTTKSLTDLKLAQVVFTNRWNESTYTYDDIKVAEGLEQGIVECDAEGNVKYKSVYTDKYIVDDKGNPCELEFLTGPEGGLGSKLITAYYETDLDDDCELIKVDQYVDVDWIISNMYIDAMNGFSSSEELGSYVEKMFTLMERLDMLHCDSSDVKTSIVIQELLDRLTVKRGKTSFSLLNTGDLSYPSYEDWFIINPDIGNALKKIDKSDDADMLWNEFNLQVMASLLKHCNLAYVTSATSKAKYRKLKELVKSLSSYLVNYIDNQGSSATDVPLPHLVQGTRTGKMEFVSYINFSLTEQTFNYKLVGDTSSLDKDLYLPAVENHAMEGVTYYTYELQIVADREDEYHFVVDDEVQPGMSWDDPSLRRTRGKQHYFKVNLREELGVPASKIFQILRINDKWYYQTGSASKFTREVETYPADSRVNYVYECEVADEFKNMRGSQNLGLDKYFREVSSDGIKWDDNAQYVGDNVAKYLDLITMSFHMTSTSKLKFEDTSEGYSPADLADYMLLSSEMIKTPYPSQTTKES